uniref:Uncharacterized protein n=1 Tax=Manihot esculenta TaxID=3983 RepID=A0A2C9VJL0_MANES
MDRGWGLMKPLIHELLPKGRHMNKIIKLCYHSY